MNESRRSFLKKTLLPGLVFGASSLTADIPGVAERHWDQKNGLVFLFQGDSITDGNRGRNDDLNHIMGHGYAYSIASRIGADFPEKQFKFINKGISGNKITDLARRWQADTVDLEPDVLSMLIGVNDTASIVKQRVNPVDIVLYEETYSTLLNQTREKFPNILFVLGEPFILPVGTQNNWALWEQDIAKRRLVVQKLAEKHNAVYIRYQHTFQNAVKKAPAEYWLWDGIHPTVAGHELMAREWIKQVSKKLKFLQHYRY